MTKTETLTEIFSTILEATEVCHGFELQGNFVELWIKADGYKYYEKQVSLEDFHNSIQRYFNND